MKNAAAVFDFLTAAAARGERTALVTLTDVIGRSSRAPGTHMAVSETGASFGSFSGGCVEAAVVAEAQRVIESNAAEVIRFGDGSRFIDIKLPCGGGIDLLITPAPATDQVALASEWLAERLPIVLSLRTDGGISVRPGTDGERTGWADKDFLVRHDPDLRLVVVGHGEETRAMAGLAAAYGAHVSVLSPDDLLVQALASSGLEAHHLKTPAHSPYLQTDRYSAVVMLFHDHDWETELLAQALNQDAFFIGAMGSRATHAVRIAMLEDKGVTRANIDRLTGPIGLIPATRDPETLALSALGQIAMQYEIACDTVRARTDERLPLSA